ncbi:endonuclease MutS2 [Domibacillus robiginosus]|uniref:endonuclease MutS2 n=1 Tax=Domibacillus robiginosus TaxID=1071054 RepID=UPI00067B2F9C|nr:DNA mismatch repair protein [Domibacillus robiginosus]
MNHRSFDALGYYKILSHIAAFAHTDSAKNTIHAMRPLQEKKRIEQLLLEVEEAMRILQISSSIPLHTLDDIASMLDQGKKGLYIRADQFGRVISFLDHCSKLKRFMKNKVTAAPVVSSYAASIEEMSELEADISACIRHDRIDDHASAHLAYIRRQKSILLDKLRDYVQALVKGKKYGPYLQERVVSERSGRFVLPIKKEHRARVKGTVLDTSASGSTLFIEPIECSEKQEEISYFQLAEEAEAERILYELTEKVLAHEQDLHLAMEVMHHYDVLFAKAKYSASIEAVVPQLNEEDRIDLKEARHPMLGKQAVPLSIQFGDREHALVITGPNTGGKTVTLKTVGLLTLMAQSGLPIPAKEGSRVAIFQHVFVDIGDGQSIEDNLSTFSSRLVSIIDILRQANNHTLVCIDELGSGTDPGEGMGLAVAILEQLYEKGATLFATTHYSEMKSFADQKEGFLNGSMEFDLDTLKPTYKLVLGKSGQSQAFDIALKLGLHPALVEKAYEVTYQEKKSFHNRFAEEKLRSADYQNQVTINRYKHTKPSRNERKRNPVPFFTQGDNVVLKATNETGIVFKGPDASGQYIVQVKGEKQSISHKRLSLLISAAELYPADYDFDIIFKSKEYRKIKKDQSRKHVEGAWLEEEEDG